MDYIRDDMVGRGSHYYEEEIDLIDLIRVIWDYKKILISGILVLTVVFSVTTIFLSRGYILESIISPGIIDIREDGKKIYLESPSSIKALIESGVLSPTIFSMRPEYSKLFSSPDSISFQVKTFKETDSVMVMFPGNNTKLAKDILSDLNKVLIDRYSSIVNLYEKKADTSIQGAKQSIAELEKKMNNSTGEIEIFKNTFSMEIQKLDNKISFLEAQKRNFIFKKEKILSVIKGQEGEMETLRANTASLIKQRDSMVNNKKLEKTASVSLMVYLNIIQQNLSLVNGMSTALNENYSKVTNINIEINKINNQIKDLESTKIQKKGNFKLTLEQKTSDIASISQKIGLKNRELDELKSKKRLISNIQVVQEPRKNMKRSGASNLNLVFLLSFISSCMIMIFGIFSYEYIRKNW